jgi:hypothetical protein
VLGFLLIRKPELTASAVLEPVRRLWSRRGLGELTALFHPRVEIDGSDAAALLALYAPEGAVKRSDLPLQLFAKPLAKALDAAVLAVARNSTATVGSYELFSPGGIVSGLVASELTYPDVTWTDVPWMGIEQLLGRRLAGSSAEKRGLADTLVARAATPGGSVLALVRDGKPLSAPEPLPPGDHVIGTPCCYMASDRTPPRPQAL